MKSLNEVKTFYKEATVDTNPAYDRSVLIDALQAGGLKTKKSAAHTRPKVWRFIMKNSITKIATAGLAVLVATLGIVLMDRSVQTVYGMAKALELIAQARNMHIQGWSLNQDSTSGDRMKLPFEQWYDFENGRYRVDSTYDQDGKVHNYLEICDGQYIMTEGGYIPKGGTLHNTVDFEQVDPNAKRSSTDLDWYNQLRQIEGFRKVDEEIIRGKRYEIWQGEYNRGVGDSVRQKRLQAWLSPDTGEVVRTRNLGKQNGQWFIGYERTLIERDVSLPENVFVTEPRPGFEIKTSKEKATVAIRRPFDIYDDTQYRYASLNYHVRPIFALKGGCLLACWQGVDNLESRDQSKYFADLQVGGNLPKLPVEVFALSPEPNVRNVLFSGFHLAHTEKETELGRRWYEWSLYIPDKEPPKLDAVLNYRINYRLNVKRTDCLAIRYNQQITPDPQMIETESDFEAKVLKAMAECSEEGSIPEHVTYENVMRITKQLQTSIAK